jgi:predicted small lipoprotein YifL
MIMVGIRIAAICGAVLLGACGQTGPLVLANDNGDAEKSAPVESPASTTISPKSPNNATTPSAE